MRQIISGLIAAVVIMTAGAAPAMACGYGPCSPCSTVYASPCGAVYVPVYSYSYYSRLVEPTTQYRPLQPRTRYYYVNQGPTYTGPGEFAPYPTYEGYYYSPLRQRHARHVTRHHGQPVLRRYY